MNLARSILRSPRTAKRRLHCAFSRCRMGARLPLAACISLLAAPASWGQAGAAGNDNAATTAAERTIYELGRLRAFDDERLPVALMAAVAIGLVAVVWQLYRRDAVELSSGARLGVVLLRCAALAGLLVFFLGIERRTMTEVVHNSQVAVLVDSSLSMGLSEDNEPVGTGGRTRSEAVAAALAESPLLAELRQTHDVQIARFDQEVDPIVALPKRDPSDQSATGPRAPDDAHPEPESNPAQQSRLEAIDWHAELQPRGTQTRIGQALVEQLRQYRGAPLAGVVIVTDGAQNAGIEPTAAIDAAREAGVTFYAVGIGSSEPQRNIAVRDLVLPARAFPGDTLNVTGYLQSDGFPRTTVEAELSRRSADEPAGAGDRIAAQRVTIGAEGELVPVSFDIEPGEPGRYVYQLRIQAPPDDSNPGDNHREAEIDIVDRQTRVLLFASGPMRDYQYLRNQLHRDPSMTVDVLLQTAQPGISQDASELLDRFPSTAEELFPYDCIVAFDPDWTELDATQVQLLEKWIAEEAGGMITVAGPIHTARWTRSTEHAKLRDLYPVVFQQRLTLLDDGQYGGEVAWPLAFERAGREARFLWLENSAEENSAAWDRFAGVYGYYAVRGEKPGATVYARFSDPEAALRNEQPAYLAGQFYGAGQVFYIGSGEMWRLRAVDPAYFEVLYTKLIRHVSQGRILRGSARGALLVERDRYELGETVVLRARLADEQHRPLTADNVTAQVLRPDGLAEPVRLAADVERPGMYVGQVSVLQEGTYQIALSLPGGGEEPISRYVQVRVPDLERSHSERNDALLAALANDTGGMYYRGLKDAIQGDAERSPLAQSIPSRAEVKLLRGAPDQQFARAQMQWLLAVIAGALFVEWIVRRLNRLA